MNNAQTQGERPTSPRLDPRIRRLGTLGGERGDLTCSMHVARTWNGADGVEPFGSFEEAGLALKRGQLDGVLIPGAYPRLGEFIMDAQLVVTDSFVMRIPDLLLARKHRCRDVAVERVYHHPATTSLIPETGLTGFIAVPVTSNVAACEALLSDNGAAACITNRLCAIHFELDVVLTLREGLLMPWVCFRQQGVLT